MKERPLRKATPSAAAPDWDLRLYIAGPDPKSSSAFRNLTKICEEHLPGRYEIKVIDLAKNPQVALDDQILAVPTVVRKQPLPIRRIVGTLVDTKRALAGLDLPLSSSTPFTTRQAS